MKVTRILTSQVVILVRLGTTPHEWRLSVVITQDQHHVRNRCYASHRDHEASNAERLFNASHRTVRKPSRIRFQIHFQQHKQFPLRLHKSL